MAGSRASPSPSIGGTPSKTARLEEKQQLQELNGRLEYYILRFREFEAANQELTLELQSLRDRSRREAQDVCYDESVMLCIY